MTALVECMSCGGLKRADTEVCPHCKEAAPRGDQLLKRALTAAGLGAIAACGPAPNQYLMADYGIACLPEADSGYCGVVLPTPDAGPRDAGADGGRITDAGSDGNYTGADAYGIVCSYDPDSGTCVPPMQDAGPRDAGNDSGDDDD